jgi:hypothetical protein
MSKTPLPSGEDDKNQSALDSVAPEHSQDRSPANHPLQKLAYSINETLAVVPFSRAYIYQQIAAGRLKVRKSGRRTIVMADDLRQWLDSLETVN